MGLTLTGGYGSKAAYEGCSKIGNKVAPINPLLPHKQKLLQPSFETTTLCLFCFDSCKLMVSKESEFDGVLTCLTGLAWDVQYIFFIEMTGLCKYDNEEIDKQEPEEEL